MRNQPFHEGEIAVQERAGEREFARRHGAGISSQIVAGALPFLARQRLLAVTAAGDDGNLWTSVWGGQPGFVSSQDGRHVSIRPQLMATVPDDPVLRRLAIGREVGILAIELTSRRRLRINGMVEAVSPDEIRIAVRESVPNCPKYIQRRQPDDLSSPSASRRPVQRGRTLDDERRALLERIDTAFVGSLHPTRGVDASHRGGAPGFIRVLNATTLRVPDYAGNSMFMTLGNFEIDARASLTVVDFETGQVVAFSGAARVHVGVENPSHTAGGSGRYWDFEIREWVQFDLQPGVRWELVEASPFNP